MRALSTLRRPDRLLARHIVWRQIQIHVQASVRRRVGATAQAALRIDDVSYTGTTAGSGPCSS